MELYLLRNLSILVSFLCMSAMAAPLHLPGANDPINDKLAFTCAYEKDHIPPLDPDADKLFKHARWLQKKNLIKQDLSVNPVVERLYRIAAAWGHDKANHNLAMMLMKGESTASDYKTLPVDLAEDLIKRGIPQGYYDMGYLLDRGYGVKQDKSAAKKYFRKAADLGSPEAQYYIGDQLTQFGKSEPVAYKVGYDMKRCAAEQGHREAASEVAIRTKNEVRFDNKGTYADAVKYFQLAVKAGDETLVLADAFRAPSPDDRMSYLALEKDEERARRYEVLSDILGKYSYLNPNVEEIDVIVPLPPAKLPPWDGQIKFQKEWKKNVPPPLPSEERIAEMARAKGLDPDTGRPVKKG